MSSSEKRQEARKKAQRLEQIQKQKKAIKMCQNLNNLKDFLIKQKLKFKVIQDGGRKFEYHRGIAFVNKISKFSKEIQPMIKDFYDKSIIYGSDELTYEILKKPRQEENDTRTEKEIQIEQRKIEKQERTLQFIQFLLDRQLLIRYERKENDDGTQNYPNELEYSGRFRQKADIDKFYRWNIPQHQQSSLKQKIILFIIAFCVLALFSFKAWPVWLKIKLFKVIVVLLYLLAFSWLIRLIVFFIFWLFGFAFWIYPNLFDDDVSFAQSFVPLYTFTEFVDNNITWILKIISLITTGYLLYILIVFPQAILRYKDVGQGYHESILKWGQDKLEGKIDKDMLKNSLPSYSDIVNDTINNTQEQINQSDD